jgi:dihydrofolate synthase / folylpolyglutamate synthase
VAVALTANAYERALASIEAVSWRGISLGLERTEALLAALGNPHIGLRGALVAGTNGKGSVCAVIDSVARAAGLHTVLLTKPHLASYRERIVIDGELIGEEQFVTVVDEVTRAAASLPESLQPTGFEMLTVVGVLCAAREAAELLVCEVGMGGRLDSTNVLDLGVAVVTNVALDHREHLGETIPAIALEKAAIIKQANDAVTAAEEPALGVIRARCAEVAAPLQSASVSAAAGIDDGLAGVELKSLFAGHELHVGAPLVGRFQIANLATAIAACDALRARGVRIDTAAVVEGCATVQWRGRMQWVPGRPPVLVDAAHNPAGMAAMVDSVAGLGRWRSVVAVFAAMRDKDVDGMAAELQRLPGVIPIVTAPTVERARAPQELAVKFHPPARIANDVASAVDMARDVAGPDGLVLVCGSLYLVAEALTVLSA